MWRARPAADRVDSAMDPQPGLRKTKARGRELIPRHRIQASDSIEVSGWRDARERDAVEELHQHPQEPG